MNNLVVSFIEVMIACGKALLGLIILWGVVFFFVWAAREDAREEANINKSATNLRGSSICETSNSVVERVQINSVGGGSSNNSSTTSTVVCRNVANGELTSKEFKTVFYSEGK